MNMLGMKDGYLGLLMLLASIQDIRSSGLFISQNTSTKVPTDDSFAVVCRDELEGLPVTWYNPKGVPLGTKSRPRVDTMAAGTSIVFVSPHRSEDAGNYTCATEKQKRVFELFIEPLLKFTDTAANQTGKEGDDFVLKCEVTGGSVSWAVEGGGIIDQSPKYRVIGDGLLIRNVTRHDSKTYICKGVQQRTGIVLDRRIHFFVRHKPVHPSHPQKHMRQDVVYGYINGSVNLTCLAVAYPPASFNWTAKTPHQPIGQIINESPEVSIMQILIRNKSVFGNYKCIATNKYGSYEENFTLKQGMKPVTPERIEIKEVQGKRTIVEIVGPARTPEMDLDIRGFSVQYKKIDGEWQQEEFNITKNNLYVLDGLEPNTMYQLQAATRNAAGLSDYSPLKHWTTSGTATVSVLSFLYCVCAAVALW